MAEVPESQEQYSGRPRRSCGVAEQRVLQAVDPDQGLSLYGSIDHSGFYNGDPDSYWCYQDIRRSIFMGDYLYAMSDRGITASELEGLNRTASLTLPGSSCAVYWDGVEPGEKRPEDKKD